MQLVREITAEVDCLERLPAMPTILSRLLSSLQDPRASLDDIAGIVGDDPVIAGQLLKVAGSAAYAFKSPPRSLRDVFMRIGLGEVRRVAMALSVVRVLPVRHPRLSQERFWQHSMCVALVAQGRQPD